MNDTGRCDHCSHPTLPGESYCRHCGGVVGWNTPSVESPKHTAFLLLHLPGGIVRKEGLKALATKVGRGAGCEIVVEHPRVSRLHALFELRDGACWVSDLKSSGGTFVNDRPVHGPVRLKSGDTCRLGRLPEDSVTLVYHEEA